jgi:NADPH-dependent ferric siderophore reductase
MVRLLGGLMLRRARVVEAEDVASFRRIRLEGDFAKPTSGTKVQVLLPSDDVRTYTPIASNVGSLLLLGWKHAGGPGARWLSEVTVGTEVRFIAPRPSLELPPGPVIVVGDETSVAVAASFEVERPSQVRTILIGDSTEALRAGAASVGVNPLHVAQRAETASVVEAVIAARATAPQATVALTGGSELVVAVREGLRARGLRDLKTKTYWVPGKAGLD